MVKDGLNMKVLLVSEYFPPKVFGGGEISAEHLARALSEKGVDVSVLTAGFPGLKEFESIGKVRIHRRLRTGGIPGSLLSNIRRKFLFPHSVKREIGRLEKEENFDLIHFLNTNSIISLKGKRTIATINSYGNLCPKGNLFYKEKGVCLGCNPLRYILCILSSEYSGKLRLGFYLRYNPLFWLFSYLNYKRRKKALRGIDEFIAISEFIMDLLLRNGIRRERVHKVPNIVDIKDSGREYHLKEKGVLITYIGALERIKGVDLLIEAFNRIRENAFLLIAGEGSERKTLEKISERRVRFLGRIDYEFMPSVYRQSDIIALPARWPEPLPRVLLEACYFGRPIIATDVGGNADIVDDRENGFLVKTPAELNEKIGILVRNSKLRGRMGKRSREIFEERFSKEKVIERILDVYRG